VSDHPPIEAQLVFDDARSTFIAEIDSLTAGTAAEPHNVRREQPD
jgi:hypothetical protein